VMRSLREMPLGLALRRGRRAVPACNATDELCARVLEGFQTDVVRLEALTRRLVRIAET